MNERESLRHVAGNLSASTIQSLNVNPRAQTLFKPTPSQTLGENHPIFG